MLCKILVSSLAQQASPKQDPCMLPRPVSSQPQKPAGQARGLASESGSCLGLTRVEWSEAFIMQACTTAQRASTPTLAHFD